MKLTRDDFKNKKFFLQTDDSSFAEGSANHKLCRNIIASFCKGKRLSHEEKEQADVVIYPSASPCAFEDFEERREQSGDRKTYHISEVAFILIYQCWERMSFEKKFDTLICYLRDKPAFLTEDKTIRKILNTMAKSQTTNLLYISKWTNNGNRLLEIALENDDVDLFKGILEYRPLTVNNIDSVIARCESAPSITNYLTEQKPKLFSEIDSIGQIPAEKRTLKEWRDLFKLACRDGKIALTGYKGTHDSVTIPGTIDGKPVLLCDSVFNTKNGKLLTKIEIDEKVEVSDKALVRNNKLKDNDGFLILNDTLYGCWPSRTSSVVIPSHVKHIHYGVFSDWYFDGPARFTGYGSPINPSAFELKKVVLPQGLKTIGAFAFSGCGINKIIMPDSVTEVGAEAFFNCKKLSSATLSKSLTRIEKLTFAFCGLKTIKIPESVTFIGERAFESCYELQKIYIPRNVEEIEDDAFKHCNQLSEIVVDENNPHFYAENNILVRKRDNAVIAVALADSKKTEIKFPDGVEKICVDTLLRRIAPFLETISFPESLKEIGAQVFDSMPYLESVTFPGGLEKIGALAFAACVKLKTAYIPASVTKISELAFQGCKQLIIKAPAGSYAIQYAKENGIRYEEI